MEKLTTITATGVPLRRSNVDTDQIIPAVFLKRVTRTGFDDALFYAWRRDPNFVLNQPEYRDGRILVAGLLFEHLPDQLDRLLRHNRSQHAVLRSVAIEDVRKTRRDDHAEPVVMQCPHGVLAAIMPQESIELIWKMLEEEPGRQMTVDLETRTVTIDDVVLPFEVNDYVRWRLMNGYDDIDLTLQHEDDIAAYERMRAEKFPFKPKTLPAITEEAETVESAREPEAVEWAGPLADR